MGDGVNGFLQRQRTHRSGMAARTDQRRTSRMLTIITRHRGAKNRHPTATCRCDCGRKCTVRQSVLRRGLVDCCATCSRKKSWASRPRRSLSDLAMRRSFDTYKANARRKRLAFELSLEEFGSLVKSPCTYCGVQPQRPMRHKRGISDVLCTGIDRIDSALGYVAENVCPCCDQCNYAKRQMCRAAFLAWVDRIYHHQHRKS